ncbi:MAG: cbb3-type cytochrome c oxidase subunit I [Limnochordaceae bacterium]|uniref:Cbb3-type cytochrome c oxidase subunit I n=1 Tax=Carboxydichorda subterranea TaxID=3109565 RepID=A0ABZ1C130_9FIRM|nr:cbb3-type cytochrome c oxidase subunit I [Limnochorda sp. L945t]MBE3597749.1 cbb3-type cytochrome c oxidase subunit I [Limnochordaceae bacterium]WRP18540.1 cbb3-type cytochrome c oxidase subunit I [Limnochorda sp. L945t]
MAVIEQEARTAHEVAHRESFWRRYVFSLDHKVIGIQYLVTSFVMALVGGLLAMLMRLELGWPGSSWPLLGRILPQGFPNGIMNQGFYLSLVTMHGTIMIFYVMSTALTGGFGNFLIPLQIGARDMAFPLLNMLSYWLFPVASAVLLAAFFVPGGAPISGWTAYAPLSATPLAGPGEGLGQTLWLVSLAILIVAFLFGSLNYITTVLQLRTRGMSMMRLPLSTWALFITAILSLLSFPVLLAAAIMLLFDRHAGTTFFLPAGAVIGGKTITAGGGDPLLWQHLFWFLGHPEVYILVLPAMGIVSEVISNNARKPVFGYPVMVLTISAIAFLSFLVWGHHMFVSGMHPMLGTAFMTTTLIIAVPSAIKTFNWLATLWGGKLRFTPAMLFAIGFVSLFVTGGLTGLLLGQPAFNMYVHDTYFVVAHFHFVMASAALFGMFAGLYHWFPKMFGRMLDERLGRWHFWLALPATFGTFFPMHFAGLAGMMRRIYSPQMYGYLSGLSGVNAFVSVSAFVMFVAHMLFVVNVVWSLAKGKRAEANPWQATSLEWTTSSPPPHGNWGERQPVVYRWAYDYSLPGSDRDFVPQTVPAEVAAPAAVQGGQ